MADGALLRAMDTVEATYVARLRDLVEAGLAGLDLPDVPVELYDPIRYALGGGGKRLRPVLVLLAAEAAGGDARAALPAALATEIFHTFTLVHDDIMDHGLERRGRPAVHVVWGESSAILAGDLLMGLAYDQLARTPTDDLAELLRIFHRMVAAVCEGQALDKAFEGRENVTVDDYLDMISRKTGALIVCAMELGARIASAEQETARRLSEAGRELGRAFQMQDDLLDLTADDELWGKAIGGDLIEGKKTFLLLRSLETARAGDGAFFQQILTDGGLDAGLVGEARRRMRALGILDEAASAVERHCAAAVEALEGVPPSAAQRTLIWLSRSLASRGR